MNMKKNIFGGGHAHSLYVPMSEIEQEFLSRLVDAGDLRVVIVGWGYVDKPRIILGDLRLGVHFYLNFTKPDVPMPVPFLDLELRTGSGILLFRERQPTMYGGLPIQVASGVSLELMWDIAIKSIDPKLIKSMMKIHGLTSQRQDRDTGEMTREGNMKLTANKRRILKMLENGEHTIKASRKKK